MEQVENQPRFSISSFGARAPCSAPGQPPPPVGTRHPCAPTTQPGADPDEGPSLVGRFCTRRRIGRLDATSRPLHPLLLMSTAFGGSRSLAPKPPEKGVFPLDHFNECKQVRERERVRGPGFARECAGRGLRESARAGGCERVRGPALATPLLPSSAAVGAALLPLLTPIPLPLSSASGQGRLHGLPGLARGGRGALRRHCQGVPGVPDGPVRSDGRDDKRRARGRARRAG